MSPPDDAGAAAWLVLTGPTERRHREEPPGARSILLPVAAGIALVLLVVVLGGTWASRRVAEREAVAEAARTADLLAEVVVSQSLSDGLVARDHQALARVDQAVRSHVLGPGILRVKLWAADGRIVYSDEPRLVGERFALGQEERDALAHPRTRAEVSDLSQPENRYERGRGKLLEVYRPVWTPGGTPLLFETYTPYGSVTRRAHDLWRAFAGITASSLLFLAVLLLPVMWRLLDRLRAAHAQREGLLQRAVDASDEERRRIAGTLHDGLVQELAASSYAVAGAAQRAASAGRPELATELDRVAGTVRSGIGSLRSLLVDIYPPTLEQAGLAPALGDLVPGLRARGTAVLVEVDGQAADRLAPDEAALVYRVAQECLRNTGKHAAATEVSVLLSPAPGAAAVLEVRDDGRGFDPGEVLRGPEAGHFGLRVMIDLARAAGATLAVRSAEGQGTTWRLEVPAR
ncbi:signal transduction histidine kinase [Motilibacter rhizosphaerae]|uniref:Signal transduction histidine kinase n=1 Tax=Motilibacter rhizosphaerae TaxID=598652 RepID=A0A4Q7NAT3_9ACTN|nr:histidine kinase [Motilibacter rhizosphaerae]RZS79975.1 signal transduction histidine kinase [Motilibacter rhizosphaerae]